MVVNLDLSGAHAKLDRAAEHFEALKGELIDAAQSPPYALRHGEVDPETLWCSIYLTPLDPPWRLKCAILAGDLHHNLRCALDYIVTELVDKSGATLTRKHQFPIFRSKDHYMKWVGFPVPHERGPLEGVKHGLVEIEALQPYKTDPGDPEQSPLWHLHEFSNADKHRAISLIYPRFLGGPFFVTSDVPQPDMWRPPERYTWEEGREYELARVRFASMPSKIGLNYELNTEILFVVGTELEGEEKRLAHDFPFLEVICRAATKVVNIFEEL
jgi:hypothetical protein